ncbi:MAG: DUF4340 domain-containing protein [Gammaproteobacteria bacterium]|nr:DUF4340 domain-containing protein [Gammaproteobacteria bacterium]
MTPRNRLNLVLLGGVLVLVLVVVYQPGLQQPPPLAQLTPLVPAQIIRIRIERSADDTILLEKESPGWVLQAPVAMPANNFRVEAVLQTAQAPVHARMQAAEVSLAEFKLDQPRVRLWLDDTEIAFGGTEPLSGRRYVQTGDSVVLITDTGYFDLVGDFTAFADTALLAPDARLTQIDLPALRLVRLREGSWMQAPNRAQMPPASNTSMDMINALHDAWRLTRATQVRPYVAAEHAETAGDDIVFIGVEGDAVPLRFDILSRAPELVLGRADLGIQYRLPASAAERLLSLSAHSAR